MIDTFTAGKYAGVPLEQIPEMELQREYVRNPAISPRGRMQAAMVVTKRLGCPSVPLKSLERPVPVVAPKEVPRKLLPHCYPHCRSSAQVSRDLAEQIMQALEWYANQSNGEKARAALIRLYAEKGGAG